MREPLPPLLKVPRGRRASMWPASTRCGNIVTTDSLTTQYIASMWPASTRCGNHEWNRWRTEQAWLQCGPHRLDAGTCGSWHEFAMAELASMWPASTRCGNRDCLSSCRIGIADADCEWLSARQYGSKVLRRHVIVAPVVVEGYILRAATGILALRGCSRGDCAKKTGPLFRTRQRLAGGEGWVVVDFAG